MVLRMTVYCMILNTRQHTLLQEEVSERWIRGLRSNHAKNHVKKATF